LAETPQLPPPPPHLDSYYEGAIGWSAKKNDLPHAPLQSSLCAVVEAPAKPAQRQEVRIADQIAIRSYVLAKNIGKIGEKMHLARANIRKNIFFLITLNLPSRCFNFFVPNFAIFSLFPIKHSLHHYFNYNNITF
jgi:hypothetical protein